MAVPRCRSASNPGRRSGVCRSARLPLRLLFTCTCVFASLFFAANPVEATGWFFRFLPIQREEHLRLEGLKASGTPPQAGRQAREEESARARGEEKERDREASASEGGEKRRDGGDGGLRVIQEKETGRGSDERSEEGRSSSNLLPGFLRRFLPSPSFQSGQVNLSTDQERRLETDTDTNEAGDRERREQWGGEGSRSREADRGELEVQEGWFLQPLDHGNPLVFNRLGHDAWRQKFYRAKRKRRSSKEEESTEVAGHAKTERQNDSLTDDAIRPIFVYIGGEGPLSSLEVKQGLLAEMGDIFGASLYALEHRYYGDSHPRPDSSVVNLQWLTSHQALGDLAAFVAHVKQQEAEEHPQDLAPEDVPVVVFGCSYPGSLAAYARAKYPASILGAVSSSSPVEASALFQAFDRVVQRVLPAACTAKVKAATAVVERRLFSGEEEAVKVAAKFGCGADVPMKTHDQRVALLYVIADAIAESVQYNRQPTRPWIEEVCACFSETASEREETHDNKGDKREKHDSEEDLVNALAKAVQLMLAKLKMTCKDSNLLQLTDTRLGPQASASARLWTWQSCAEYGYWQVAYKDSVRSHLIDLDWHMRMCNALFPLPSGSKFSTDVVAETNVWSGDKLVAGVGAATNIHFTNGENDPWAPLSVTEVSPVVVDRQGLSSFTIQDGSHCNDFYAYGGTEPVAVTEAKARIQNAIRAWLEDFRERREQQKRKVDPPLTKTFSATSVGGDSEL
ncbi:serine carboxypeptidase s28 protein [Toxoplasma gondii VEG]|uniref:Serine carboxypeptidase S28, putative n=4 Tax=Toxoplasma gondii TaxID=5811 RepID=B9QJ23_TOXGV|nr:serine carboxypeptidase s28 protein [Toxoplasma gondii VEG]CEL72260.1 TPA: serine carboxypeptidase S28, putative [Toxoplasma gondii VEG]